MKYLSLIAALTLFGAAAHAEPRRIVSLNPCLDTALAHLADRDQIAALSHFSLDATSSTISDFAHTMPITHETAEEVMSFNPDLVLASRHSSLATRNALTRVGIKIELFTEPQSVEQSIAQVRRVAGLIGQTERGEDLVAKIEAALAAAAPAPDTQPITALVYQRNGFSTGSGSLVDEMLHRTGFVNSASRYGQKGWANIPLERLLLDPPQVLLAGEIEASTPTWADRVVRHPALRHLEGRMTRVTFPDRLIYCGGPVLIPEANMLATARQKATGAAQ